ncbi:MAG: AmmeMemoRadiSam system protein A [Thermoanaerobacterales bacterium]|nr:AmmeMemoRadiSam system protein A [Bacillota bacterium]MDI6907133.1 AmmeMemoRadiSam system protein A [Thermoanaerobacterales bacterium]
MGIVFCGVVPHPPIMVPEVGRGEAGKVRATQDALRELGRRIKESGAETLVIISPHGPVFSDAVGLIITPRSGGDLGRFGAPEAAVDRTTDLELAEAIGREARALDLHIVAIDEGLARRYRDLSTELDHGFVAPLYWLERGGADLPLLAVGMSLMPRDRLYAFGVAVRRAAERLGRKAALVASGDLSHRLTPDAPAGFHERGKEFDATVVEIFRTGEIERLLALDEVLAECAGECGLRSMIMMLGALDGHRFASEVLSYEGPFGVGYMVAALQPGEPDEERRLLDRLITQRRKAVEARREGESYIVRLARRSLENYLRGEAPPDPGEIPPEFRRPAGAFVSLKKDGQLRGCIGTIAPTRPTAAEEVMENAVSAGTRDPRFFPVEIDELDEIVYSVDILGEPEPVDSLDQLDPKRYGVIVRARGRSGLLLPDLEGIDTAEQQVAIARQKAGLSPDEPVKLERFEVKRYR